MSSKRLATGVVVAAVALTGCSHHHAVGAPSAVPTFGPLPSWLPKDTGALHQVLDASVTNPVLASQGDTVRVHLAHGMVTATLVGPEVPNQGLPNAPKTSPATWLLTLKDASGDVPLSAAAFNTIDEVGRVYRLRSTSTASLPAHVLPGQTVLVKLTTTMLTGEGRFRWIPYGHQSPVEWDFTLETD